MKTNVGPYLNELQKTDNELGRQLTLLKATLVADPDDTGKNFLLTSLDNIPYAEILDDEGKCKITVLRSGKESLVEKFFECWALHYRLCADFESDISIVQQ